MSRSQMIGEMQLECPEGSCQYLIGDSCEDIVELRKSIVDGLPDEELMVQYHELCTCGGFNCGTRAQLDRTALEIRE